MDKIIFELTNIRETPHSPERVNVEIQFIPARQKGKAKELAERIIVCIEDFVREENATVDKFDVKKF